MLCDLNINYECPTSLFYFEVFDKFHMQMSGSKKSSLRGYKIRTLQT